VHFEDETFLLKSANYVPSIDPRRDYILIQNEESDAIITERKIMQYPSHNNSYLFLL